MKGTMQNEHMLLQPRVMLTNALFAPAARTGATSAYVSSRLSCTFIALAAPPFTSRSSRGRSRYASGPAANRTIVGWSWSQTSAP